MRSLELKVPPPLAWLVCALLAVALARAFPAFTFPFAGHRALAWLVTLAGIGCGVIGLAAFRRRRTNVDPHHPERATALVTTGLYRHTRNPMYLGLALVLLGVISWRANLVALLTLPVFVGWITRFQIRPEERILAELFGDDYRAYRRAVRRWL